VIECANIRIIIIVIVIYSDFVLINIRVLLIMNYIVLNVLLPLSNKQTNKQTNKQI